MFTLTVDTTAVEAAIDDMTAKLRVLYPMEMNREFIAWQEDDMHRKSPSVDIEAPDGLFTMIYPRGRPGYVHKRERSKKSKLKSNVVAPQQIGSSRPILRPELLDMLSNRMSQLLGGIDWR